MLLEWKNNSKMAILSLVVSLLAVQMIVVVDCDDSDQQQQGLWQSYKSRFGKKYLNSVSDSSKKKNFLANLQKIAQFNADESHGFKLGVNSFADESTDELKSKRRGLARVKQLKKVVSDPTPSSSIEDDSVKQGLKSAIKSAVGSYPTLLNYQNTGYVSAVKDQGSCGSCWAFSSTAAVEGQTYRLGGKMISASQQQLVDCSNSGEWANSGCDGGLEVNSYLYMSNGMMSEQDYPYITSEGSCQAVSSKYVVATKSASYSSDGSEINGVYTDSTRTVANYYAFYEIVDDGTGDLKDSFADTVVQILNDIGPIAVQVCASSDLFNLYSSGIFHEGACEDDNLDHSILLVGYNISSGDSTQRYWIAKNQWGTSWGLDGYIYMRYGAGLIRNPTYPNIDTSYIVSASTRQLQLSTHLATGLSTVVALLAVLHLRV